MSPESPTWRANYRIAIPASPSGLYPAVEFQDGDLLTPFFVTRQRNEEGRGCQVENGDGARRKGIGHGVVLIRHLGVYGQALIRDGLDLKGGIFCLLK